MLASVVLATLFFANAAYADSASDAARAQALFDDALKSMEAKDFSSACPKLAESLALDRAGGTALDLGFCFEHAGRLASALHAYENALAIAQADGRTDRSLSAKNKIDELEKTTGHIRLILPLLSSRSEKWHAAVDETPVTSEDLSVPTAADAGPHVVTIIATDKRTFERRVVVNDGLTTDVVVEGLVDALTPAPIVSSRHEARPVSPVFTIRDDVPRRNWGIGIGSAGVVGLGVGTVAAIVAASLHAHSNAVCPASGCTGDGIDAEKQADRAAWVADIGFVAGAALVGVGTYLFFSARHSQRVSTMSKLTNANFAFDLP